MRRNPVRNALTANIRRQEFNDLMKRGKYAQVLNKFPHLLEPDVRAKLIADLEKNKLKVKESNETKT